MPKPAWKQLQEDFESSLLGAAVRDLILVRDGHHDSAVSDDKDQATDQPIGPDSLAQ